MMNAYELAAELNKSRAHTGYNLVPVSDTDIELANEYQARSFPNDLKVYAMGVYLAGGANVKDCRLIAEYIGERRVRMTRKAGA